MKKKRYQKIMCYGLIGAMMMGGFSNSVHAMQNEKTQTTINELLNESDYLFLQGEKPAVDLTGSTILIHAESGQVIYGEDSEFPLPILSVTKILSAYVILDKMNESESSLGWESTVTASETIADISTNYMFSGSTMYAGQSYTIKELFEAMMIESNNAATMLLGEVVAGGERAFVELINNKVHNLNLKQTQIFTSTGLTKDDLLQYGYADIEAGVNIMSVADIAFMTKELIADYPDILRITAQHRVPFGALTADPVEIENSNALVKDGTYEYIGVNGLKTGGDIMNWTSNIAITAEKDNVKLIAVRIGAFNSDTRSVEMTNLLDYGFKNVNHITAVSPESKLFTQDGKIRVKHGTKGTMEVKVNDKLFISTSFDDLNVDLYFVPTNTKYDKNTGKFSAPLKENEKLGVLTVKYRDLTYLTNMDDEMYAIDVYAAEDINNGFYLFNWLVDIKDWFINLIN